MTAHYDGQAPLRLAIQSNLEQRAFKNRVSPITLLISSHFVRSTQKSTTNWGDFFDKFRQWFCKCIYYCSRWSSFVPIKDEITICILTFSRLFLSKNGSILGARQLFEKAIKLIFFSSSLILPTFSTPALWRYQEWHLEFRAEVSPTFPTKVLVAHYEETITKVSTFLKLVFPPQKWQSLMGGAVLQTAPFIILQALPISFFFLVSFSNLPGIWFSCLLWWSKCKAKQFWKRPADFGISQLEAQ